MKKMMGLCLTLGIGLGACAYGGVAVTADGNAVVTRNDAFLFGLLRKVFVCKVQPTGLTGCVEGEHP